MPSHYMQVQQLIGELLSLRATPAPLFSHVGVDYAGPLLYHRGNPRKPTIVNCYVCVFVCMVTHAVHLEISAGLSTEDFLVALQRFVARRGVPTIICSDNGTNFVVAERELRDLFRSLHEDYNQACICQWMSVHGIE